MNLKISIILLALTGCSNPPVELTGNIDQGWADRAIAKIQEANATGVVLSSQGGLVMEARKLARWLRQQEITTHVTDRCSSACVEAFAGGTQRTMHSTAQLGLHQAAGKAAFTSAQKQEVFTREAKYYLEMGISEAYKVAHISAMVPSSSMFWIGADAARNLGLTNVY